MLVFRGLPVSDNIFAGDLSLEHDDALVSAVFYLLTVSKAHGLT